MLETLCKDDKHFRDYAYSLCKDDFEKDDLVNEMYIKVYDIAERKPETLAKINRGYALLVIRNLFFNTQLIKYNTISLPDNFNALDNVDNLENRIEINNCLSTLNWFDREILLFTHEESIRSLATKIGCNHQTVANYKKKALPKLKKTWEDQQKNN